MTHDHSRSRHDGGGGSGDAGGGRRRRRTPGKGQVGPKATAGAPAAAPRGESTIGHRWASVTGTLLHDTEKPFSPLAPGLFEWVVYAFVLDDDDDADAVQERLSLPGREPYLAAFLDARAQLQRDRRKLSAIERAIADLVRGGDLQENGAKIVAQHASLTANGKRAVAQKPSLVTERLKRYVEGPSYKHGVLAGGEAGGDGRKGACSELLDGLLHGAPRLVLPRAPAGAQASANESGADRIAEQARQLRDYIRLEISGALGKPLTRDELAKLEGRIRAADPRVREVVLHDAEVRDLLVQGIDPSHARVLVDGLDAVEALHHECRDAMPVVRLGDVRLPKPAGINNQAIAILRPWFLTHPAPMRQRALQHAGLQGDVYAHLPEAQRREVTRLASTGTLAPAPHDELLDAVEAKDGVHTIGALRALAAADGDALARLQRDTAFMTAITRLDRPVAVGRQELIPLQVCRELWGAAAEVDEPAPATAAVAPLTAEERLLLGHDLFDPFVEEVHHIIEGRSRKRAADPFDFSSASLNGAWGLPDYAARGRALREVLTRFEHTAASPRFVTWLRRERLAAGPELERRLEQRHHVSLTEWSSKLSAADRGHVARVTDAGPSAATGVESASAVAGIISVSQALHQVMVLGRTMSEWTADESQALARAIASRDKDRTLGIWNRYVAAAAAAVPQIFVLSGAQVTPAELMRNAFRVHAGDLGTRVAAAFSGEPLARIRAALQLDAAVEVPTTAPSVDGDEKVGAGFTDAEAEARAAKMWRVLQDGGRVDVIDVHLLSDLSRAELRMVDAAFRAKSGGIDFAVYVREAMRVRAEQSEVRAGAQRVMGYRFDDQQVTVGGKTLMIHGSDTELERALAFAEGRGLDARLRLRIAAGNKSGEQVQRVLNELSSEQRATFLADGPLVDHLRQHLGQRDWEQALKTLSSNTPATPPPSAEDGENEAAPADDGGWSALVAARGTKAVLRALGELRFDAAQRLQQDVATQVAIMQRVDESHRAEARGILSQRSDASGGATDRADYDARQAVNRMRIALGQSWKAALTQAVAVYQLPLEREQRLRVWTQLNAQVRGFAVRQRQPGGVTDDAITEDGIVKVLSDAVLGQADPSDALVAANIETVEERHAKNARLSEQVGRPIGGPVALPGLDHGIKESSTVNEDALADAMRAASPRHVVEHWTSVLQPSVTGDESMKARYERVRAAANEAEARRAVEAFVHYAIGLSAEFEHMLVPHMGNDRTATKAEAGPRIDQRDNKRYNALAQIIRGRIADLPPSVLVTAMDMDPRHASLLGDARDPDKMSATFRTIALDRALDEEHVDRRGVGAGNISHARAKGEAYDVSAARLRQDQARELHTNGLISDEAAQQLGLRRSETIHDRDAHKQALESEAAWKSLIVGTLATVLVSVLTAGAGTGLAATLLLTAVTAGAGSAVSAKIKRDILGVDFDDQDAVEQIRQDVYQAVVNAAASHLAKQLLKLKDVADKVERVKALLSGAPPWLTRMLGGAGENLLSEVITIGLETGGGAISGDDVGAILRGAPKRLFRSTLTGAVSGALGGDHGAAAKGWNPVATGKQIFNGKSIALDTAFALLFGDQPLTLAGARDAALGAVQGNAVSAHGEHSDGEDEHEHGNEATRERETSRDREQPTHLELGDEPQLAAKRSSSTEGPAHPTSYQPTVTGDAAVDRAHANLDRKGVWLANQLHGLAYNAGAFTVRVAGELHVIVVRPKHLANATSDVHVGKHLHVITVDVQLRPAMFEQLVLEKLHQVTRGVRGQHHERHHGSIVISGEDQRIFEYAAKIPRGPDTLDIILHGGPDHGYVYKDGKRIALDAKMLANLIKQSGKAYSLVRLLSCDTGSHPQALAQHLANQLGVIVFAPSDKLFITEHGELVIGPSADQDTGSFEAFAPEKSSRREGAQSGDTISEAVPDGADADDDELALGSKQETPLKKAAYKKDRRFDNEHYLPSEAADRDLEKLVEFREDAADEAQAAKEGLARLAKELGIKRKKLTGEAEAAHQALERAAEKAKDNPKKLALVEAAVHLREQLTSARVSGTRASEAVGGRVVIDYMETHHPGAIRAFPYDSGVPTGGRPGELDFVYVEGRWPSWKIIVVEAKGATAKKGTRRSSDGRYLVEQGTRTSLRDVATQMRKAVLASNTPNAQTVRLLDAIASGGAEVSYLHVSAPIGADGVHGRIRTFSKRSK